MDSDQAKLFVGGISWETNEDALKDHFNEYGVVLESTIMRDKNTGNARGFGFVTFSDPSAADKALQEPKHVILGRTVEVKKAIPRGEQNHPQQQSQQHQQQNRGAMSKSSSTSSSGGSGGHNGGGQFKNRKIFVGGLSANITEEDFRAYFEKYGRITDVVVMYDGATHRPRGFGFITFDSDEAVDSVLQKSFHELNDKRVEVKLAVPKDGSNGNYSNGGNSYSMRSGGSGRGSAFGSYPGGVFPPYCPRFGFYHGYMPPPVSGYGNASGYPFGGYPAMGGYGGVGYGAAPMVPPRSPWNSMGMVGARRSPAPYGTAALYPGYVNGGVGGYMGMTVSAYRGVGSAANGKWNQGGGDAQMTASAGYGGVQGTTSTRSDGGNLDDDTSGLSGSYGSGGGNKQNQRGPDGQFRPYTSRVA